MKSLCLTQITSWAHNFLSFLLLLINALCSFCIPVSRTPQQDSLTASVDCAVIQDLLGDFVHTEHDSYLWHHSHVVDGQSTIQSFSEAILRVHCDKGGYTTTRNRGKEKITIKYDKCFWCKNLPYTILITDIHPLQVIMNSYNLWYNEHAAQNNGLTVQIEEQCTSIAEFRVSISAS